MSRRQLKADDEWGFLLAYWDEVTDLSEDYKVDVTCDIRRTRERGKIAFHLTATGIEGGPLEGAFLVADLQYPSPSATRLHAALYSAAVRLAVAVSHEYEDRTGLVHPRAIGTARKTD